MIMGTVCVFPMPIEKGHITDIQFDPNNANEGTEYGDRLLGESLQSVGIGRGVVCDRNRIAIGGNKTTGKASESFDDAIFVPTNGNTLVVTVREDLDLLADPESDEYRKAIELAVADNRVSQANTNLSDDVLRQLYNQNTAIGKYFTKEQIAAWEDLANQRNGNGSGSKSGPQDDPLNFAPYPSSNEWGIPDLLPELEAEEPPFNALKWGSVKRGQEHYGLIHFYTDDYKFSAIWDKPQQLVESLPTAVVEPNFTTWRDMPPALAMSDIYKKRWLARYWQSQGIQIWVDINVAFHLYELNFLGVPQGWTHFATRYFAKHYLSDEPAGIEVNLEELRICQEFAGTEDVELIVYGGSPSLFEDVPPQIIHIPEHNDKVRGRVDG